MNSRRVTPLPEHSRDTPTLWKFITVLRGQCTVHIYWVIPSVITMYASRRTSRLNNLFGYFKLSSRFQTEIEKVFNWWLFSFIIWVIQIFISFSNAFKLLPMTCFNRGRYQDTRCTTWYL